MLSICNPTIAASTCSTVKTFAVPSPSVVPLDISTTKSALAGISGFPPRSTLTNFIPLFSGAGTKVIVHDVPVCNPIPDKETGFAIVLWSSSISHLSKLIEKFSLPKMQFFLLTF